MAMVQGSISAMTWSKWSRVTWPLNTMCHLTDAVIEEIRELQHRQLLALGYYIGRKSAGDSTEDTSTNAFFCGDFENSNTDDTGKVEAPTTTSAPEEAIDEAPHGA